MNRETIKKIIEDNCAEYIKEQFLQCGSSIQNPMARDIDIMVYVSGNLYDFFDSFLMRYKDRYIIKKSFADIWKMYSLKVKENNEVISFHIVSVEDLRKYVERACEPEIYTDINLFSLSMKLPTVYRKWIIDTNHLYGNRSMKEELLSMLNQQRMPVVAIQELLRKRIINSVNYYFEKSDSALFSGIIISQIFNDCVLYCYAENGLYYGTLKYLESDLKSFTKGTELAEESISLYKAINREDTKSISVRLRKMQKLLY